MDKAIGLLSGELDSTLATKDKTIRFLRNLFGFGSVYIRR